MRDKLIALFVNRGHKGSEIVSEVKEILSLIDAQRCVWTFLDDKTIETECGQILSPYRIDDLIKRKKPSHCWNCGKRIEVKEG